MDLITGFVYVLAVAVKDMVLSNVIGFVIFQHKNNAINLEAVNRKIARIFSPT